MPITPRFELSQDDIHVYLTLRIPFIRPSSSELYVDENGQDLSFYCSPYLLKLRLPHSVLPCQEEDTNQNYEATYDPNIENGTLTVKLIKEIRGQYYEDLDMLTKLMIPISDFKDTLKDSSATNETLSDGKPLITVVNSSDKDESLDCIESDKAPSLLEELESSTCHSHYGFLNKYSKVFQDWNKSRIDSYSYLQQEMCVELPNPDFVPSDERRSLRLKHEKNSFKADRYLGDFFEGEEDMIYQMATQMENLHWKQNYESDIDVRGDDDIVVDLSKRLNHLSTTDEQEITQKSKPNHSFAQDENDILVRLSHKTFKEISDRDRHQVFMSLADILFAYAYDHRTTDGDPTPESAWTIAILSPTLSWFEQYSIDDRPVRSIVFAMRRSLIYPYLRYWPLASIIANDVLEIFQGGRRVILRCLLQVFRIFEKTDTHYIMNKLYIHDYCVWIQQAIDEDIKEFTVRLKSDFNLLTKESLDLNLLQLETHAIEANEESSSSQCSDSESSESNLSDEDDINSSQHSLSKETNPNPPLIQEVN